MISYLFVFILLVFLSPIERANAPNFVGSFDVFAVDNTFSEFASIFIVLCEIFIGVECVVMNLRDYFLGICGSIVQYVFLLL